MTRASRKMQFYYVQSRVELLLMLLIIWSRINEWIKHVLICGMTGVGKTNVTFQILKELRKKGKLFLIFDWKKNYRDLIQLSGFENLEGIYCRQGYISV